MSFIILIRMSTSGDLWTIEDIEENRVEEFDTLEVEWGWMTRHGWLNPLLQLSFGKS